MAAHLRLDVEVLEVDPVSPLPGRVVEEPQRESGDLAVVLGYVSEYGRLLAEERPPQIAGGRFHLVQRLLVHREFTNQRQESRDVFGAGRSDHISQASR